jgi:hypothetical protein
MLKDLHKNIEKLENKKHCVFKNLKSLKVI